MLRGCVSCVCAPVHSSVSVWAARAALGTCYCCLFAGAVARADHPEFRPNLTPAEVLQLGSFGGTYFRPIDSGTTHERYMDAWKEFPAEWFEGLNIKRQVTRSWASYDVSVNKYGVKCGGTLDMWESSGWISTIDPYGWFQWFCRFYLGRRSTDDERQIARGNGTVREILPIVDTPPPPGSCFLAVPVC
jgi:hypothetical protein